MEDGTALLEFDGIAAEADGIIFSRGNIGLDVAPEKMARVQKCNPISGVVDLLCHLITLCEPVCCLAKWPHARRTLSVADFSMSHVLCTQGGTQFIEQSAHRIHVWRCCKQRVSAAHCTAITGA